MTALLRADWLRYRRRLDLRLICLGVLLIGAVGFLNGYKQDVTDPSQMTAAEFREMAASPYFFGDPDNPPTPSQIEEFVAQQLADQQLQLAEWDAGQLTTLQKYDIAQSPLTIIGFGFVPVIALLIISTLIVGDEFRFGTVRSSLIAASPRRRFLAARLITIGAFTIGLFGALAILGVVLSLVLHLVGAELPPATIAIHPLASISTVLGEILVAFTIMAFAVALTVIVRSGAIPVLLVLLVLATDAFLANLPVFFLGELFAGVPQFSLTTSIRTLVTTLAPSSGALAYEGIEPPPAAIAIPSWGVALIICAWLALFLTIADRRFRTMDIVE